MFSVHKLVELEWMRIYSIASGCSSWCFGWVSCNSSREIYMIFFFLLMDFTSRDFREEKMEISVEKCVAERKNCQTNFTKICNSLFLFWTWLLFTSQSIINSLFLKCTVFSDYDKLHRPFFSKCKAQVIQLTVFLQLVIGFVDLVTLAGVYCGWFKCWCFETV